MDSVNSKLFWFQFSLFILFAAALLSPLTGQAQEWALQKLHPLCPTVTAINDPDTKTSTITIPLHEDITARYMKFVLGPDTKEWSMRLSWKEENSAQIQESHGQLGESPQLTGNIVYADYNISTTSSGTNLGFNPSEPGAALMGRIPGQDYEVFAVARIGVNHFLILADLESQRIICDATNLAGFFSLSGPGHILLMVNTPDTLNVYVNQVEDLQQVREDLLAQIETIGQEKSGLAAQVGGQAQQVLDLTDQLTQCTSEKLNLTSQYSTTAEEQEQCVTAFTSVSGKLNIANTRIQDLENERIRLVKAMDESYAALKTGKQNLGRVIKSGGYAGLTFLKGFRSYIRGKLKEITNILTGNQGNTSNNKSKKGK